MTCHGCQAAPAMSGSHYCDTCEHAWRTGAAVIGGAAVLPMAILAQDDPGAIAGQLDLAHALNPKEHDMPDTRPTFTDPRDALRYHVTGAIERGEATAITEERRTGDDRRAPVPSPTGDRWRNTADTLDALADAAADVREEAWLQPGYGQGSEDAYRAAANIVRALADTEDIR